MVYMVSLGVVTCHCQSLSRQLDVVHLLEGVYHSIKHVISHCQ